MQLHPVLNWEGHVGEHIRLGLVHQRGELRDLGAELVGDAAPLLFCTRRVILGEGRIASSRLGATRHSPGFAS